MTPYGQPRVWLEQFPLGEPLPFEIGYLGLCYPGEVIRSDSWDPEWGEPLVGDRYFRIVLLSHQSTASSPFISDSRTALCLPATGESQQRDRLLNEMATIRETQALYQTQPDPEADSIRRTLLRYYQGLEAALMSQEASRYSSGTILAGPDRRTLPSDHLTGADPVDWFSHIARWLLTYAYPELPIDAEALRREVTAEDPRRLFSVIFHQADESPEILAELGPSLGLSSVEHPRVYNPSDCAILDVIRKKLLEMSEPASWPELHHYLSHQIGLTGPLSTLYLLLFLHQQRPDWEVRLSPGHQLVLAGGRPLPGTRLTGDLLPALEWDNRLAEWATTIGPVTEPHWNDALPYLSALCHNLSEAYEAGSISLQEQQLLQSLARLSQEVRQSQEFLAIVNQRAGEEPDALPYLSRALGGLSRIAGNDFRSIYQSARNTYPDYRLLEQDTRLLGQLSQLAGASDELRSAWRYLDAAVVSSRLTELSIEKQALEGALAPASLFRFSRSWSYVAQQVADFKARFAAAYRVHHEWEQQSFPLYQRDLDSAGLKLRALEQLNTIPELGQPVGEGLSESLDVLDVAFASCAATAQDLDLSETPACRFCGLRLDQTLPVETLAGVLATIDARLGGKNRQLSNLLVQKILQGQLDQPLEDLLKIVQASDLSALSNTISAELVGFIRRILV
jgi:hypothetical protein